MADRDDGGRLHRKRRRLAQVKKEEEDHVKDVVDGQPKNLADSKSKPSYGFLNLISLLLEHEIPVLFPGRQRPRNAYGLLGAGASFLVFKEERTMDDVILYTGKRRSLEDRMVLKRTRQFDVVVSSDSPESLQDRRYRAIISELQILLDPFVQESEYIVDFHGLTWDFEPEADSSSSSVWPVIALEAAESTMQALKVEFDMSQAPMSTRLEYCYHVAQGLELLHSRGVVHCDVKLENVLICVTERSGAVAKICDFGSAVLGVTVDTHLPHGLAGTAPWTAPEYRKPLRGLDILKTDVYSFGLLLWRFLSTSSTLRNLDQAVGDERSRQMKQLDVLKSSEQIVALAQAELRIDHAQSSVREIIIEVLSKSLLLAPEQRCSMRDVTLMLAQAIDAAYSDDAEEIPDQHLVASGDGSNQEKIPVSGMEEFDDVPEQILPVNLNPFLIDFEKVYEVLEDETSAVKAHLVSSLEMHTKDVYVSTSTAGEAAYQLALCHSNGFGTPRDPQHAWNWMLRSARLQNVKAHAHAYPMFRNTIGQEITNQMRSELLEWLQNAVRHGSTESARHLRDFDRDVYLQAIYSWTKRYCGNDGNSSPGYSPASAIHSIPDKFRQIPFDIVVNSRGNRVIHQAASLGDIDLLKIIINAGADIDCPNAKGESALLCAIKANEPAAVLLLLDHGANVRPARSGESPLHWLIAVENSSIEIIASRLVKAGANIEEQYLKIEENEFVFDIYPLGTPLDWAVSKRCLEAITTLIELGANPFNECSQYSALTRAASLHDWKVLRILLKSEFATPESVGRLESTGHGFLFEALYCYPLHDRMMLHGEDLRPAATKTVKSLIEAGCDSASVDADGTTVMHMLAGFCDYDMMIWLVEEFDFTKYINTVAGSSKRTPIHNALASGIVDTFKALIDRGADLDVRVFDLTILHLLASAQDEGFASKCLTILQPNLRQNLNSLAKVETLSEDFPTGITAFELAVFSSNLKVADQLLLAGASPTGPDTRDLHFVSLLITSTDWTSLSSLQYYMAKVQCPLIARKSTSLSLLHLAASMMQHLTDTVTGEQKLDVIIKAFSSKDDINTITTSSTSAEIASGQTPLHYAAKFGVSRAARKLLLAGADTGIKDDRGNTALDLARTQLASLKAKMLEEVYPRECAELQSTLDILEQSENVEALRATDIDSTAAQIRTHLSMLGFETELTHIA